MKKIFLIILPLALIFMGAGCNNSQTALIEKQQKQIEDLTKNVEKLSQDNSKIQQEQKTIDSQQRKIVASNVSYRKYIPSVVKVSCQQTNGSFFEGSGILRKNNDGSFRVITNAHVIGDPDPTYVADPNADKPPYSKIEYWCQIYTIKNEIDKPIIGSGKIFDGKVDIVNRTLDLATLDIVDINDNNNLRQVTKEDLSDLVDAPLRCEKNKIHIGDKLFVLGYPDVGGDTITVTDGIISSFETGLGVNYIATSAKISHGNSGGLVINESGCTLGVATFAKIGEVESMGYVIDVTK